ncbi:general transcription factor II-I repeat domain-containing protein 2 [Trichonephila clavipes]|nr:general transcription factor II-I repeat domain-containing protein 2 [Trichonephila clavipes]
MDAVTIDVTRVEVALRFRLTTIAIYRSFAGVVTLGRPSTGLRTTVYVNCRELLGKIKGKIVFQWVPSHCGLWGNERADFLAKKGTGILQNFRRDLTLHSTKLEIKRIFRESFRITASRVARDKPWSTLLTSPICVLCDTGQDMTAAHLDECPALNDLNCIVKRSSLLYEQLEYQDARKNQFIYDIWAHLKAFKLKLNRGFLSSSLTTTLNSIHSVNQEKLENYGDDLKKLYSEYKSRPQGFSAIRSELDIFTMPFNVNFRHLKIQVLRVVDEHIGDRLEVKRKAAYLVDKDKLITE